MTPQPVVRNMAIRPPRPGNSIIIFRLAFFCLAFLFSSSLFAQDSASAVIKKPTVGQKIIHFFSSLEKKVFGKKHTGADSTTTSKAHHQLLHAASADSSSISIAAQKKNFLQSSSGSPKVSTANKTPHPSVEIFGYYPYWIGNSNEAFVQDFLTTVAYFSFELNPATGSISNPEKGFSFDSLKKVGSKTVITVTNFGSDNNSSFLSNKESQQKFIDYIVAAITANNLDGISIDFEEVPLSQKDNYTFFIKSLSAAVKQKNNSFQVSAALPATDPSGIFDIVALSAYLDYFIVMAYDYYWKNSRDAGPNSPLISGKPWLAGFSVAASVHEYLVKKMPANKMLLGIPYYGIKWKTSSTSIPSPQQSYQAMPYYEITQLPNFAKAAFDTASLSEYFMYKDQNQDYEVWFDGTKSLSAKYQFVLENNLGGIAIWCLGYDRNNPELWQAIVDNFDSSFAENIRTTPAGDQFSLSNLTAIDTSVQTASFGGNQIDSGFESNNSVYGLLGVTGRKKIILAGLMLLTVFFFTGFVISFINQSLISLFTEKISPLYLVLAFVFGLAVIILLLTGNIKNNWQLFVLGFATALLLMLLLSRIKKDKRRKP